MKPAHDQQRVEPLVQARQIRPGGQELAGGPGDSMLLTRADRLGRDADDLGVADAWRVHRRDGHERIRVAHAEHP